MANTTVCEGWPWKGSIHDVQIALREAIAAECETNNLPVLITQAEKQLFGIVPWNEKTNEMNPDWILAIAKIDELRAKANGQK